METVFARASGAGKAGVAVYRLSGPKALEIAGALTGEDLPPRSAQLKSITEPGGTVIDRGLVILFPEPKSYTGEDVVEFHLHGSLAVEKDFYRVVKNLGARPAAPGEFTLRALRNGKTDLAQVEALADLIDSETSSQRKQALGQLDGRLSAVAETWRIGLIASLAPLESAIDFADEGDVPEDVALAAASELRALIAGLEGHLQEAAAARQIREGVTVALIGPPNAGKSSLINRLAGSDVSIVSPTPGATRDIVEARLDMGGVLVRVFDTAGLHGASADDIEREGMARALARAQEAALRVLVIDLEQAVSRETGGLPSPVDLFPEAETVIQDGDFVAWNKADRTDRPAADKTTIGPAFRISALTGDGLEVFIEALTARVTQNVHTADGALTRVRHSSAVEDAIAALRRAAAGLSDPQMRGTPELIAEDVRLAARALGSITGAVGAEDVLGEIFSSFCIGK